MPAPEAMKFLRHGELPLCKMRQAQPSTMGTEASCLDPTAIACRSCCLTLILQKSGLYICGTSQPEGQVLQC